MRDDEKNLAILETAATQLKHDLEDILALQEIGRASLMKSKAVKLI